MPELPEVETVKRELSKSLIGRTFSLPVIYNLNCVQTYIDEYKNKVNKSKISSLSREGKFLIIHLENRGKLIFHLRMEGKLFYEEKSKIWGHLFFKRRRKRTFI